MWWAKQMFGSEKKFSQNYTPEHLFGLSGKKFCEHLFDEKTGANICSDVTRGTLLT